jgi:alcohol dehydrogenase
VETKPLRARLSTHAFSLAEIEAAYDLFSHQRDGVMKVAIRS